MYKLITLLITITVLACERPRGDTVQVCTEQRCGTAWGYGDHGGLMTAAHLWASGTPDEPLMIKHPELGDIPTRVVRFSKKLDLAYVEIEDYDPEVYDPRPWELCKFIPPTAAHVAILSEAPHPGGQRLGKVVIPVWHDKGVDADMVVVTARTFGGNSGGPVILTLNDCIIGQVYGTYEEKPNYTAAVNTHEIQEFFGAGER